MRLFLPLLTALMAWPLAICFGVQSYRPVTVDPMVEPWSWQTLDELEGLSARCRVLGPS